MRRLNRDALEDLASSAIVSVAAQGDRLIEKGFDEGMTIETDTGLKNKLRLFAFEGEVVRGGVGQQAEALIVMAWSGCSCSAPTPEGTPNRAAIWIFSSPRDVSEGCLPLAACTRILRKLLACPLTCSPPTAWMKVSGRRSRLKRRRPSPLGAAIHSDGGFGLGRTDPFMVRTHLMCVTSGNRVPVRTSLLRGVIGMIPVKHASLRAIVLLAGFFLALVLQGCAGGSDITQAPPSSQGPGQPPVSPDPTVSPGGSTRKSDVLIAGDARKDDGTPFVIWDDSSVIPFLAPVEESSSEKTYSLGLWDLEEGKVSISSEPLFTAPKDSRVYWDGATRFTLTGFTPVGDETVTLRDTRLTLRTAHLPRRAWRYVACQADGDVPAVVAAYRDTFRQSILQIEQDGTPAHRIALSPPGMSSDTSIVGPVAIEASSSEDVIVYLETHSTDDPKRSVCQLWEATWDGQAVTWRLACPDMDLTEAGSGTQKGRFGNALIVSDHRIRLIDLGSGEIAHLPALDEARAAFRDEFVEHVEYSAPAMVTGYGGYLIMQWNVPSVEDRPGGPSRFIPTSYLAAVRDGQILGEIKSVDGPTWVLKNGSRTQELSEYPGLWVFPEGR